MSPSMSPLEIHARHTPDGVAYRLIPSDRTVTWRELELRSRKLAAAMHVAGLRAGDGIAVMLENHLRYFEILWAAQRYDEAAKYYVHYLENWPNGEKSAMIQKRLDETR